MLDCGRHGGACLLLLSAMSIVLASSWGPGQSLSKLATLVKFSMKHPGRISAIAIDPQPWTTVQFHAIVVALFCDPLPPSAINPFRATGFSDALNVAPVAYRAGLIGNGIPNDVDFLGRLDQPRWSAPSFVRGRFKA